MSFNKLKYLYNSSMDQLRRGNYNDHTNIIQLTTGARLAHWNVVNLCACYNTAHFYMQYGPFTSNFGPRIQLITLCLGSCKDGLPACSWSSSRRGRQCRSVSLCLQQNDLAGESKSSLPAALFETCTGQMAKYCKQHEYKLLFIGAIFIIIQ